MRSVLDCRTGRGGEDDTDVSVTSPCVSNGDAVAASEGEFFVGTGGIGGEELVELAAAGSSKGESNCGTLKMSAFDLRELLELAGAAARGGRRAALGAWAK